MPARQDEPSEYRTQDDEASHNDQHFCQYSLFRLLTRYALPAFSPNCPLHETGAGELQVITKGAGTRLMNLLH
jgi:hypothetical protein